MHYIFSPLNHPEDTSQVFCFALAVHCGHTIVIARQWVALPRMRAFLHFVFSMLHYQIRKFWSLWFIWKHEYFGFYNTEVLGLGLCSSVLHTPDQVVPAFSRLALGASCVQEPCGGWGSEEPGGGFMLMELDHAAQVWQGTLHNYTVWPWVQLMKWVCIINGEAQ